MVIALLLPIPLLLPIQGLAANWTAEEVISGLNIPWGLSVIDNENVMLTERSGQVKLLNLKTRELKPLVEVERVTASGQGGLLDVARSPFESNRFYFTYSQRVDGAMETTLASAVYNGNTLRDWDDLLVTYSGSDTGRHFGSRITFDDKFVYFSIGDRGVRQNGQDRSTHAGSILRVNPDGSIPDDNPFIGNAKIQPQIWSYGHRNPQGLYYDPPTKSLWSIEHGPRGGDEVNLITKGANYGWPVTSHGKEYWGPVAVGEAQEKEEIVSPRKVYIPSIAPGSLVLYRGQYYPSLNGKLLAGALKLTHINVLSLDKYNNVVKEERILESLRERIRDIETLPSGEIIFSTDSGKIYRLKNSN
ncbi:PQQ-dependent sugar dehydrogenase [Vibrio japonicus]|uniref:PQQ-dependent sugar dehydrogenase n=1 Tax=Vibrio japonicus TaxID=1824638 RepID=A0ABY5LIJ5_9VIBR|nr:PQQ-dependent sugar dehydrogenase [Vibrio japonicus]UUM31844.1 PQQ-dependent sugar dehydrogenase [Vibrio japonicus]